MKVMTEDYTYQDEEEYIPVELREDYQEKPGLLHRAARKVLDPLLGEEKPVFRVLSLDDLENIEDPEWLLHGIMPADSLVTLFGAPGSAKSFWALDAACSIASGHMFHGCEVKQSKVVYAVGEGLRGMKWRVEAWKLAHPDADMEALHENLIIIPQSAHLLEKQDAEKLLNTVEHIANGAHVGLFIIDTWARALVGGDENSAGDAGKAISVCDSIRLTTGATVLIVHHTGADGQRERGSTALRGASDASLQMSKSEIDGTVVLSCRKMKDGENFRAVTYKLEGYGHSAALVIQPGLYSSPKPPTTNTYSKYRSREEGPF